MAIPFRTLLSQVSYNTDGSTTVWDFSFAGGYLDQDHVKVQLRNIVTGVVTLVPITVANFVGPYQLSLTPALAVGSELTIYRDTPKDLPLVDFADKANLTESSLDLNAKQAIFVAAESADIITTSLGSVQDTAGYADAANLSAVAANASKIAAAASAAAALVSQGAASTSATNANASAVAAAASAASIAGGPVASIAGLTGVVTAAALNAAAGPTAPVSAAQAAADAATWALSPRFDTYITKNGANLEVARNPDGGMYCFINGVNELIPSSPIVIVPGTMAAVTDFYIYVFMSGGVMTAERVTTVPAIHTNGVPIKTADPTRTLVGRCRTGAAANTFVDQIDARYVLNRWNRKPRICAAASAVSTGTTLSASLTELSTSARANFIAWGGEAVTVNVSGYASNNNATSSVITSANLNGAALGDITGWVSPVGNAIAPAVISGDGLTVAGFNYASVMGSVSAGTGTWNSFRARITYPM